MIKPGKMLRKVICAFLQKPATAMYPFIKIAKPDKFRGKLKFYQDRCIGCQLCVKDCPSKAIKIVNITPKQETPDPAKPVKKVFEAILDLDRCLYCAQCVDSCMKNALEATTEFELARVDKKGLKVKL